MRDIAVFIVLLGVLPACFLRPWIGVLVFSWIGYMNPHRMAYGSAFDFPFAQVVALVTLAGFAVLVFRQGMPKMHWRRETVLILLLWGNVLPDDEDCITSRSRMAEIHGHIEDSAFHIPDSIVDRHP